MLKLRSYKTTVMHALQPAIQLTGFIFAAGFYSLLPKVRSIRNWYSFLMKCGFLQRYINTQNNCYWSSQYPHLSEEAPLHPVKFGVWCALSARGIVGPVFFQQNNWLRKIFTCRGTAFSTPSVICELYLIHSERYRPTGILIHRQHSHAPSSQRCVNRREAEGREAINKIRTSLYIYASFLVCRPISLFLFQSLNNSVKR
jgi:hypothetical protein